MTAVAIVLMCAGLFGVAAAITGDGWRASDFGWRAATEALITVTAGSTALALPLSVVASLAGQAWGRVR
jgi:hypothetical protein